MTEYNQLRLTDLSWNKIKRFGMRIISGLDRFRDYQKTKKAEFDKKVAELIADGVDETAAKQEVINGEFGLDSLKAMIEAVMEKEEEFILSAVGDLFDCTAEEAGEIPIKHWINIVLEDKYIRPLLPRWYKLELQMHSDT